MCRHHSQPPFRRQGAEVWYPQLETRLGALTTGLRPALSCLIDMASIPLLSWVSDMLRNTYEGSIRDSEQGEAGLSQGPAGGHVADKAVDLSPQ